MNFTAIQVIKLAILTAEAEESGDYATADAMHALLQIALKELA
jgi:hypothetical protein